MTQLDSRDAMQFAKIRWMANTIENCSIQVYVSRHQDPEMAAREISDILLTAHNAIKRLASVGGGCPAGWEGDNGYCFPCGVASAHFTGVLAPGL